MLENLNKPLVNKDIEYHSTDLGILLRNKKTNRTFSIGKRELELLKSFDGTLTIEELKEKNKHLVNARSMEKFILLAYKNELLEKDIKEQKKFNIIQVKFPLINVSKILKKGICTNILMNFIFLSAIISIIFIGKLFVENGGDIVSKILTNQYIQFKNLIYYFGSILIIGFIHEFAHAITIINLGGQVFELGFMFNYFHPAFYVDITGVGRLKKKKDRISVWIAGIAAQLMILAPSLYLTFDINSKFYSNDFLLVFNIINVSMILFNVLFVIKLDGYYLLCEALEIKDLREKSISYIKNIFTEKNSDENLTNKIIYLVMGLIVMTYLPVFVANLVIFITNTFFPERVHLVAIVMTVCICISLTGAIIRGILKYIKIRMGKI